MEGYVVGNFISGNTIANNSKWGISLITWMPLHSPAKENIVSGNTITNNGNGIYLSESSNNFVYHNNVEENTVQVFTENSVSVWNNGYPSGGNYWSDQVCTGNPSDGSQPYVLDWNNTDHYPFQVPNGWAIPVAVNVDEIADTNYAATGREALASHLGHLRWKFKTYVNKNSVMDFLDFFQIARNFGMSTLIVQWMCWRQARGCLENPNVVLVKARMHNQFEYCCKDKELWTECYRRFFYNKFP
jgi:parallel beta-helix repeat protein